MEKKEEFGVTREFILLAHEAACSDWKTKLEDKFPAAFSRRIKTKTWYKGKPGHLYCITDIRLDQCFDGSIGTTQYGWHRGKWRDKFTWANTSATNRLELATPEEVTEAFQKEAKFRGYTPFTLYHTVSNINPGEIKQVGDEAVFRAYIGANNGGTQVTDGYGGTIFYAGEWGAIHVPTMTKEKAEAKLGVKIVCDE